ncbi:MAG: hypothetical protein WA005_08680 [Candidatus Binataceae bacterium]
MFHKRLRIVVLVLFAYTLAACAATYEKQSTLENATKRFSDVVSSSSSILQLEVTDKPRIRRAESLQLFLINPHDETNFTSSGDKRAFAQYLCAGTSSLRKEKAFLDFAQSYATGAQGIVKPGGDTFADQWQKYKELQKPLSGLEYDDASRNRAKSSTTTA